MPLTGHTRLPGGFQTVALVGFVSPVAVAVFGPLVGQALDNTPRQLGLTITAGLQAMFITAAGYYKAFQASQISVHCRAGMTKHDKSLQHPVQYNCCPP